MGTKKLAHGLFCCNKTGYIISVATLILLFSLSFITDLIAQENPSALYDQGNYQQALELLHKNGIQSAADHYNVANCYFKLGKLGQALAYYEKASSLSTHEDTEYNLKLTQDLVSKSGIVPKNTSLWAGRLVPKFKRLPEGVLELGLFLVSIGLVIKKYRLPFLLIWSILAGLTGLTWAAKKTPLASVIADSTTARSGPNEKFTELFKLPAGTTIELSNEMRDGWQQIRFQSTKVGWISEKDLLKL